MAVYVERGLLYCREAYNNIHVWQQHNVLGPGLFSGFRVLAFKFRGLGFRITCVSHLHNVAGGFSGFDCDSLGNHASLGEFEGLRKFREISAPIDLLCKNVIELTFENLCLVEDE